MIRCINLRNRFGDHYKTRIEEPTTSLSDPRYHIIPCKYGHIYPHGEDKTGKEGETGVLVYTSMQPDAVQSPPRLAMNR